MVSATESDNSGLGTVVTVVSMTVGTEALPTAEIWMNEVLTSVLVDTGCSRCIALDSWCSSWKREAVSVLTVSGKEHFCKGTGVVHLRLSNGTSVDVDVFVVNSNPLGFPFILSMNGIVALGRIAVDVERRVRLGLEDIAMCGAGDAMISVEEQDFRMTYDHVANSWTVMYKWSQKNEPGVLQNQVEAYSVPREARTLYEEELEKWIAEGWLATYSDEKYSPAKGMIPLMAVIQRNKGKVKPVLDFRELNTCIDAFTADADVCADKLRKWRRQGSNGSVIDLKKLICKYTCMTRCGPTRRWCSKDVSTA